MWLYCLLVIFLSSNHVVYPFYSDSDLEEDWDSMNSFDIGASSEDGGRFMPQVRSHSMGTTVFTGPELPRSLRIPASELYKELFAPENDSRPVPPQIQKILLPKPVTPSRHPSGDKTVEVMCFLDRMHVRVVKSIFTVYKAQNFLRLGTCSANRQTKTRFYFMYLLKACGIERVEDADRVIYSNTLTYKPVNTGVIVRELPFTVDIQCTYAKFHRSYAVGFLPQIAGEPFFKGLTQKGPTISVIDESWKMLAVGQSFAIGKPVCFEAKGVSGEPGQRLYLNSCYVTATQNPLSTDRYSVIENYGCLVDSKISMLTKFYATTNKMTARLCVAAFLFKDMVSQPQSTKTMFLHCELELGPETPTPSTKSCMYNRRTNTWTELYGDSSVCNCCDSTCPVTPRASGKSLITSESWDLMIGKEPLSPLSPDELITEFPVDDGDFFLEIR